jgi:hypothetical protein
VKVCAGSIEATAVVFVHFLLVVHIHFIFDPDFYWSSNLFWGRLLHPFA